MTEFEKKMDAIVCCLIGTDESQRSQARAVLKTMTEERPAELDPEAKLGMMIMDMLSELGIPSNLLGYPYLLTGIRAMVKRPDLSQAITKELYPLIAKTHHTTPARVERAIRHSVETGFDRADYATITRFFGNTISPVKGKPTNSEFISRLAYQIRRKLDPVRPAFVAPA